MARTNTVQLDVVRPDPPTDSTASGATAVTVSVESPLILAGIPRVRRLTYADHISRFPDDEGMKFADEMDSRELVFFTKSVLQQAR